MTDKTNNNKLPLILGLGCGIPLGTGLLLIVGGLIYFAGQPEGGVLLANNIEDYALEHIEDNALLTTDEQLIAYYDVTVGLNGSEAAILTDQRVIYHKKGRTTAMNLADIDRIEHYQEGLIGDVIEIFTTDNQSMVIEIAPLNNGDVFLNNLERQHTAASEKTETTSDKTL